jgi:hypothetical protein
MTEGIGSVRKTIAWNAIAFGVVLAIIIGIRLEKAALAAVVGVVCGVAASIPTGLLVVMLLRRRDEKQLTRERETRQQPPVVVVTAPAAPQLPQAAAWPSAYPAPLPAQREYSVIGEEGINDEFDDW